MFVAFAVLLVTAGIVGGWQVYKRVSAPSALPPPDGPWPGTGMVSVYLCLEDSPFPTCKNKAFTHAQQQAVASVLRAHPAAYDLVFKSELQMQREFVAAAPQMAGKVHVGDLPPAFQAKLKAVDWSTLVAQLEALPGVANVIALKTMFWTGKADVVVGLCRSDTAAERAEPFSWGPSACAAPDRYPSPAERQVILERIVAVPGVVKVYYEDPDHARRVYEHEMGTSGTSTRIGVPGAFWISFGGQRPVEAVKKALDGLPGVAVVAPVLPD
ncbi:hypothetical protein J5X84_38440 [Streptosporangiaceae bacterium NEAU-GS5]|nr:hypothetical protein [Streptosporangiaceae bacterium NEAU-GS5]